MGINGERRTGPAVLEVNGIRREFFDYMARGAPFGPDDGTISPWAVVASLPFAPEIVIDTIRHAIERLDLKGRSPYGFDASFNPTYPGTSRNQHGWVSPWIFGLNQGPIILMIENFQSELIWKIIRKCPYIVDGLRRAGFRDGWLDNERLLNAGRLEIHCCIEGHGLPAGNSASDNESRDSNWPRQTRHRQQFATQYRRRSNVPAPARFWLAVLLTGVGQGSARRR